MPPTRGSKAVSKTFLFFGHAHFEVADPSGHTFHYAVKSRIGDDGKTRFYLRVRDKKQKDGFPFGYIGLLLETGDIKVTGATQYLKGTKEYDVARWALDIIFQDDVVPEGYRIAHLGKCGVCTRMLDETEMVRGICASCVKHLKPDNNHDDDIERVEDAV